MANSYPPLWHVWLGTFLDSSFLNPVSFSICAHVLVPLLTSLHHAMACVVVKCGVGPRLFSFFTGFGVISPVAGASPEVMVVGAVPMSLGVADSTYSNRFGQVLAHRRRFTSVSSPSFRLRYPCRRYSSPRLLLRR